MSAPLELLRKYNVPGPRYTSYPTVPYWDHSPTPEQWVKSISNALEISQSKGVGAALYIHIPFCESLCTYCGCNTRITRNRKVVEPYVQVLLKELDLYTKAIGRPIAVSEIHLGGGTPTFFQPEELKILMEGILSRVQLLGDSEFSVEVDPRVTTQKHLETLYELGFRRISLGVQDFDPVVQEIVHRIQSKELVQQLTETARRIGFLSINYDLIYGLPLQTIQSVENTMKAVCELRPDRIAFYSYAHVPWIKPGQRRFTENDLPSGDQKRALYELGRQMLEDVGYSEIGMDHFALPQDSLWKSSKQKTIHRNFMGYTTKQVSPLIGLGVSAIGDAWTTFAQNEKLLETYQDRVNKGELPIFRGHQLTDEDLVLRRHILNLMTQLETQWVDSAQQSDHLKGIDSWLQELVQDGLIEYSNQFCRVTEKGRPFLRNICMAFDARLIGKAPETQLFSKTI